MDQSDNVLTTYLVTPSGTTAQATAANKATLTTATEQANGSDNRLLDKFIDPALGCVPWMVKDLADPGNMVPALPLNELQAAAYQLAPIALVPAGDPMTLDGNGDQNMDKINLYRAGVDQTQITTLADASTTSYCQFMGSVFPFRLFLNQAALSAFASPDPTAATNLFNFLAMRFVTAFGAGGLDCTALLGVDVMVSVTMNHDKIAVNASVDAGDLLNTEFGGSSSPGKTNTTAIIISVVVIGQVIILVIIGAAVARYCKRKSESRAAHDEEMENYGGRRINQGNGGNDDRGLMNNNQDNRSTDRSDRSSPYGTPRRQDFYGNASPHGSNPLFNSNTNNGYDNRGNNGYDNRGNNGYDNRGNNGYDNRGNDRGNNGYDNRGNNGYDNRGNNGYDNRGNDRGNNGYNY